MNIVIGSKNPTKVNAVQEVFSNDHTVSLQVPSFVSRQPFSDEETRLGAINRAKECVVQAKEPTIGIGLEGGVMFIGKELYLCSWGALVTSNQTLYTASGARIMLPQHIQEKLLTGIELGEEMERYAQKKDIRTNEGTIGVFTNGLISRKGLFVHIVKLLKGQFEYWE